MKYWYNPNPCFGKPISQSHSLSHPHRQPNPLPSLLWRAPGWRLAGLRPNITTRPLCPPSMQQNRNSRPCFSVIGPWFVRLLTMAADWVTCYVGNIWARFLAPLADGSRGSLHNTEQHFRNIRNDPMLWWENNKKSALARFSRNDPVIHETQWNPINRPLKLTYPCHPQQPQRLLWGQISHLTIFGTTILFDHHMFATMYC